ncbi:hypothetical protein [Ruminococcus sp.]|uniref:hypothetical protein n=1 Tax=Ruminococcus sp. TaxID=41978 RepID=UPI003F037F15
MIFFFSFGVVFIVIILLFLMIISVGSVSLNQIITYYWIIPIILVIIHIIIFIITSIMKSKTMEGSITKKTIGNSLCFLGGAIRLFTESIIFFCIILGYVLRLGNGDFFSMIPAFLGFLINFGIYILLLYASYKIDFLPAKYNEGFTYITIGIINFVLSILFFLLCQFILAFSGQKDIITSIFENIPMVKPIFFLTFLWL